MIHVLRTKTKARLTVIICSSMANKIKKHTVIGKSNNLQYFKNIDIPIIKQI